MVKGRSKETPEFGNSVEYPEMRRDGLKIVSPADIYKLIGQGKDQACSVEDLARRSGTTASQVEQHIRTLLEKGFPVLKDSTGYYRLAASEGSEQRSDRKDESFVIGSEKNKAVHGLPEIPQNCNCEKR